jgi:phosphoenolpyruvate carboxykinase (ATP)
MRKDAIFGFDVPTKVQGVEDRILNPRNTWRDAAQYDAQAQKLAKMFVENFRKFEAYVSDSVRNAAPKA